MIQNIIILFLWVLSGFVAYILGDISDLLEMGSGFIFWLFSVYFLWKKTNSILKSIAWIFACSISFFVAYWAGFGIILLLSEFFSVPIFISFTFSLWLAGGIGASILLFAYNLLVKKISKHIFLLISSIAGTIALATPLMLEFLSQPVYIGGTFGGENLQLWLVMILWQGFMLLIISQLVDIDSPMNRIVIISKYIWVSIIFMVVLIIALPSLWIFATNTPEEVVTQHCEPIQKISSTKEFCDICKNEEGCSINYPIVYCSINPGIIGCERSDEKYCLVRPYAPTCTQ